MKQQTHISSLMGKHYYGGNPCIHPLAMAELMTRLENRRKYNESLGRQPQPCNPVARCLAFLRVFLG